MRYLRREDASKYVTETWGVPCAVRSLAKWAVVGGGPPFRKCGKFPLYAPTDLDVWAKARIGGLQRSTSDVPKAA
jgi:hypothetical protein